MKKLDELRVMTDEQLQNELMNLRKEQFNLRVKKAVGGLESTHVFPKIKKSIAQIKTLVTERARQTHD